MMPFLTFQYRIKVIFLAKHTSAILSGKEFSAIAWDNVPTLKYKSSCAG